MKADYSAEAVRNAARTYYDAYIKARDARVRIEQAQAELEKANNEMASLKGYLVDSVQPICGSATRPNMRIYDGKYGDVLVIYHYNHRTLIEVRKAE